MAESRDTVTLAPPLPDIRRALIARLAACNARDPDRFLTRFDVYAPDVAHLFGTLYGSDPAYEHQLRAAFEAAADAYAARPPDLHALDARREADPRWFQSHRMMGAVCYVDRFVGTLNGLHERLDYLEELGITYFHLMPPYRTPPGPNDGGYAVSSYRKINPVLGTMDDLRTLAAALRERGISLVLDFVFNHTAHDHTWAQRARQGDVETRQYYFVFKDRTVPDAYERALREIFPDEHPGAFTYYDDVDGWVWTTFHTYQWDLNYRNPAVFNAMLGEMLFLANVGVEVLRLDAVPFIWKSIGTNCENLPEAHTIIRAFNALVRIAAPALLFKSEAIVHPDAVQSYFGNREWVGRECQVSYNPLLMASMWEALATRHTHLLTYGMQQRFEIPSACAWINYVRSHDDIGWGFADEDAAAQHIDPFWHRQYLNRFYTGEETGSFAGGLPFQFNPRTLDMRISGTTASLAGLGRALDRGDEHQIELAIRRILLLYGLAISMGGIPLLYLGDEIGTLNDESYQNDPRHADDSRWAHRPRFDWARATRRTQPGTVEARVFQPLQQMIAIRKEQPCFGAAAETHVFEPPGPHLFAVLKSSGAERVLIVANFSATEQIVPAGAFDSAALTGSWIDRLGGQSFMISEKFEVPSYGLLWLEQPSSTT